MDSRSVHFRECHFSRTNESQIGSRCIREKLSKLPRTARGRRIQVSHNAFRCSRELTPQTGHNQIPFPSPDFVRRWNYFAAVTYSSKVEGFPSHPHKLQPCRGPCQIFLWGYTSKPPRRLRYHESGYDKRWKSPAYGEAGGAKGLHSLFSC